MNSVKSKKMSKSQEQSMLQSMSFINIQLKKKNRIIKSIQNYIIPLNN